jgi:ribosome-interacting GTPase 1
MAQLRDEIEKKKKAVKKGSAPSYFIEKAGAAQIVILGPTNVGRSSLLKSVTNSPVEVAPWPFTTSVPVPGMLSYKDIQFQLLEAPPIVEGSSEGKADGFQVLSLARNADALILMIDLTDDPSGNLSMVAKELENSRILTAEPKGEVEVKRRGYGSDIHFILDGSLEDCTKKDVVNLLREYKIKSALIRIKGKVTLNIVEEALFGKPEYRPTLVLANKSDLVESSDVMENVPRIVKPSNFLTISTIKTKNLAEVLGSKLFNLLGIVRVYTRQPGKEAAKEPVVARDGITVGELARMIHSDFYKRFKCARLWGPSAKFDNEMVGLDHKLLDSDVIQLMIK